MLERSLSSDRGIGSEDRQESIRASELSYRRLFEAARDGILILEVDSGRITDVNPFLVEMLGFSHDEMVGQTVAELSPFRDVVSNQEMLERLQRDGYVRYDDLPLETRDGRHVAVEFVSNVYEAGETKVIQCNIRDITERKKSEAALFQLAAIVESSDDAIIGNDLHGIVTSWNSGAKRIFGYATEEMVGASILGIIPADLRAEEEQVLQQIRRGESSECLETRRKAKNGRLIDVSVTASPVKDRLGRITGVSNVVHDVTYRKAADEKIRLLNVRLEQRVTERTEELVAANEELEAFSYSVSHDLRAPLRHIVGFAELLQDDAAATLSPKSEKYLTTITESAKRMGRLIDDLLSFSRVGRTGLNKEAVSLDELLRKTLVDLRLDTRCGKIEWKIDPLPEVRADPALLQIVLANLIGNAVKFTEKRANAKIEIGCALGGDGEKIIFIRDNGAGFDPKYIDKLFGVFQRLHSQSEFEGTGIGLANVQRAIRRHGGRVWAEGAVDFGATFYFSIPP